MKTIYYLILTCFLLSQNSFSQIPNSDFESWVFTGWYEDPESWVTNNTEILALMVIKDTDAWSGQYAVKLFTSNSLIPFMRTGFSITDHPAHLNAWVKSLISPDDSVYLLIALYNNSVLVDIGILYISNTISNYSLISVPISASAAVVDSAVIEIYGGLNYGTELKVDHLEFDYDYTGVSLIAEEIHSTVVENPFNEVLELNNAAAEENLCIDVFDLAGRKIFHIENIKGLSSTLQINTSEWQTGMYFCMMRNGKKSKVEKIVKQ